MVYPDMEVWEMKYDPSGYWEAVIGKGGAGSGNYDGPGQPRFAGGRRGEESDRPTPKNHDYSITPRKGGHAYSSEFKEAASDLASSGGDDSTVIAEVIQNAMNAAGLQLAKFGDDQPGPNVAVHVNSFKENSYGDVTSMIATATMPFSSKGDNQTRAGNLLTHLGATIISATGSGRGAKVKFSLKIE
jgi:hypothetical protein